MSIASIAQFVAALFPAYLAIKVLLSKGRHAWEDYYTSIWIAAGVSLTFSATDITIKLFLR